MKVVPKGSNYVPAICNHTMYHWLRKQEFAGKNFEFFDPGKSFFDYNIVLQNAYYRLSYEEDYEHRKRINYPDDTIILGDSGGFQMMTFEKKGKTVSKRPKIQRLVTPVTIRRKRVRAAAAVAALQKSKADAAAYTALVQKRLSEQKAARRSEISKRRSSRRASSKKE